MIEFTKELYTAINLICLLTEKPTNADEIAKELGTTKSVILNLTPKLSKAGLISASRGRYGGISMGTANPSLYDLYDALYGRVGTNLTGHAAEVHWLMTEALKGISIKENYSETQNDIPEARIEDLSPETRAMVQQGLKEAAEGKLTAFDEVAEEVLEEVDDGFTW